MKPLLVFPLHIQLQNKRLYSQQGLELLQVALLLSNKHNSKKDLALKEELKTLSKKKLKAFYYNFSLNNTLS